MLEYFLPRIHFEIIKISFTNPGHHSLMSRASFINAKNIRLVPSKAVNNVSHVIKCSDIAISYFLLFYGGAAGWFIVSREGVS